MRQKGQGEKENDWDEKKKREKTVRSLTTCGIFCIFQKIIERK